MKRKSMSKRAETSGREEAPEPSRIELGGRGGKWREQLDMIGLDGAELVRLRTAAPLIERHIGQIVEVFYASVTDVLELRSLIQRHSTLEQLKTTLRAHVIEMFAGTIDAAYVEKRERIAKAHVRIGLEPKWYIAAFHNLQSAVDDALRSGCDDPQQYGACARAVAKAFNFEQQIVLEAYEAEHSAQKERIYERVKGDVRGRIAAVSAELASLSEETSASIQDLAAGCQELFRTMTGWAAQTRLTMELSETGGSALARLENVIREMNATLGAMEEAMIRLGRSAETIGQASGIVRGIAQQTNILSLNASIEAARAGALGQGFKVVADEVRKLAEETRQSAQRIAELVGQSVSGACEVAAGIDGIKTIMEGGDRASGNARQSFENIIRAMRENMESFASLQASVGRLASVAEEIGVASGRVAMQAETLNETAMSF